MAQQLFGRTRKRCSSHKTGPDRRKRILDRRRFGPDDMSIRPSATPSTISRAGLGELKRDAARISTGSASARGTSPVLDGEAVVVQHRDLLAVLNRREPRGSRSRSCRTRHRRTPAVHRPGAPCRVEASAAARWSGVPRTGADSISRCHWFSGLNAKPGHLALRVDLEQLVASCSIRTRSAPSAAPVTAPRRWCGRAPSSLVNFSSGQLLDRSTALVLA